MYHYILSGTSMIIFIKIVCFSAERMLSEKRYSLTKNMVYLKNVLMIKIVL